MTLLVSHNIINIARLVTGKIALLVVVIGRFPSPRHSLVIYIMCTQIITLSFAIL